jgi:hypothetical protein
MKTKRLALHAGLSLLLILGLSSGGVLAGGEASPTISGGAVAPSSVESVGAQSAPLWDQTDLPGGFADSASSSNYTGAPDNQVADDFVASVISATASSYWQVTAVQVAGAYSPKSATQATSVNIQFYTDTISNTKHVPGTLVYNAIVNTTLVSSTATINLPSAALLSASTPITYWVSVQANMSVNTDAWLWAERSSASTYSGTNPSVYLGTSSSSNGTCGLAWGRRIADCQYPSSSINVDMRFAILGNQVTFSNFVYLPLVRR